MLHPPPIKWGVLFLFEPKKSFEKSELYSKIKSENPNKIGCYFYAQIAENKTSLLLRRSPLFACSKLPFFREIIQ
jgi:hypothetical protein